MNRKNKKRNNNLSKQEMSNSGAFKVLKNENESVKKSLVSTQNELEEYRSKYHESDKKNGIYESMRQTVVLHEVIKFLATGVLGGLSINWLTDQKYLYSIISFVVAIIIYICVVRIDNKIFNKKVK